MLTEIRLAADLKRRVETIVCPSCNGAKLIFKSVVFEDGFEIMEGESMTIDAHCVACQSDPALILDIREREDEDEDYD